MPSNPQSFFLNPRSRHGKCAGKCLLGIARDASLRFLDTNSKFDIIATNWKADARQNRPYTWKAKLQWTCWNFFFALHFGLTHFTLMFTWKIFHCPLAQLISTEHNATVMLHVKICVYANKCRWLMQIMTPCAVEVLRDPDGVGGWESEERAAQPYWLLVV